MKKLEGETDDKRLRMRDGRVRFVEEPESIIVKRVRNGSEVYR